MAFQKWLKANTGKTYRDAIDTYYRDFFADNQGHSLEEAIRCWKHKKQLPGHNRYEKTGLAALESAPKQ